MSTRFWYLVIALGVWLIALPLTLGTLEGALFWSDLIVGTSCLGLSLVALRTQHLWPIGALFCVSIWLQLAPLFFWAPLAWIYFNDTLCGMILLILSFSIKRSLKDSIEEVAIPQGWSCNPSAWSHRLITVALALLAGCFARYMAAFQLGYTDTIWDPIFKGGTFHVITSPLSQAFPISDAGLGAFCYGLEFVLGWQGGGRRWATMPWLVLLFSLLVIPVGAVSITLIILQPVLVGAWCSWCLLIAALMLVMILFTSQEMAAVLELLWKAKQRNECLKVLLYGIEVPKTSTTYRISPGISISNTLLVTLCVGILLLVLPAVSTIPVPVAKIYYILGPLIIACSVIACAEVFRAIRWVNLLLGLILLSTTIVIAYSTITLVLGLLCLFCSWQKGRVRHRYGSWERWIF